MNENPVEGQEEEVEAQEVSDEPVVDQPEYIGEEEVQAAEQPQEAPQEEDWRVQAIRNDPSVRERFDQALFGGQQQEAPEPQVDPVEQARQELQEIEQEAPTLDTNNMSAERVQEFLNWQEKRNNARQKVSDARVEQMQTQVMGQQARSQLEDYVQQTKSRDPDFKNYEGEFRKYIQENNIRPELLGNPTIVETIRKAIGYDHLKTNKKVKAPAPAVDEAYQGQGKSERQRRSEQQQQQLSRQPTDVDREIANFYRMPVEDYLNPAYGSEDTANWEIPGGSVGENKGGFQFTDNPRNRGRA